jgi:hypothetical protein
MRESEELTSEPERPAPIQLSTTVDMNSPIDPDDIPPLDYEFWLTAKVLDFHGNVIGNVRDMYPPPPPDDECLEEEDAD